ncbi:hypothetical protein BDR22DRAFT_850933 [Usnea florida]
MSGLLEASAHCRRPYYRASCTTMVTLTALQLFHPQIFDPPTPSANTRPTFHSPLNG